MDKEYGNYKLPTDAEWAEANGAYMVGYGDAIGLWPLSPRDVDNKEYVHNYKAGYYAGEKQAYEENLVEDMLALN